jgi:hypothetical protein
MKAAIAYYHYVDFYHNEDDILDVISSLSFINDSTFDKFFVTSYDPMTKIVRYTPEYATRVKKEKNEQERAQMDLAGATNLPPPETAADRFNCGIKRDPSQFKTFQNELYWDAWYRGFSATATAQGLANVLNHRYVPSTPNDLGLFSSQQTFMYSVLIDRLQTNNAQSILRDHEVDKDSQIIIAEVVRYYEKSSMAKNRSSTFVQPNHQHEDPYYEVERYHQELHATLG